ncbi:hypothetical protein CLD22_30850 [Rubrivivax gelatinosus]|nr:hypothetical protein [Rubrivivax gelatinosus]
MWLEGVIAESFRRGVQELVEAERGAEDFDDFIAGYARLAQHPLTLH